MKLTGIRCSRFKKFKEPIALPIAPLTIIIGKNGSGKSVVSRLPMLIAGSVSTTAGGPVDLNAGGIWHARSLPDLVFERTGRPFGLGATVANNERSISFDVELLYVSETKSIAIVDLSLSIDDVQILNVTLESYENIYDESRVYDVNIGGNAYRGVIKWQGLLPDLSCAAFIEADKAEVIGVIAQIRGAIRPPSYLGPFRAEIAGRGRYPHQRILGLGPKGESTIDFLADDKLRNSGKVCDAVESWFKGTLGGGIDTDVSGDAPMVQVAPVAGGIRLDFSDTGAGYSQSLPVVVQNLAVQNGSLDSSMLIVEQPELHLHPAAHGAIADLYIESALHGGVCFVETHSEQFISRVRRRIAEGKISEDSVQLVSIDHVDDEGLPAEPVRTITFDKRGQPSSWPYGVFEEALDDIRQLRAAARERGL
ncbi:hypothetical protein K7574_02150 [Stenotrophomonas maltophilia]|uniref:hypothetical protein n=1 Tax=Stenotrophomonas maltophilia TaxID=40324 RepID=UPI001D0C66CB|nr:hypothetical protein [Stenotrophomonas maltophilia]UXF72884.1 hypothetical protein K7574_02150 [Stenotrophomonas maltophilia]